MFSQVDIFRFRFSCQGQPKISNGRLNTAHGVLVQLPQFSSRTPRRLDRKSVCPKLARLSASLFANSVTNSDCSSGTPRRIEFTWLWRHRRECVEPARPFSTLCGPYELSQRSLYRLKSIWALMQSSLEKFQNRSPDWGLTNNSIFLRRLLPSSHRWFRGARLLSIWQQHCPEFCALR